MATVANGQRDPRLEAAAETVLRQLEAFRRDDFDTAYGFASQSIRRQFDRPAFEAMVRSGYPEIARSARAAISETAMADEAHAYVRVHVQGVNGNAVNAVYELVDEEGQWRVNGVLTVPAEGAKLPLLDDAQASVVTAHVPEPPVRIHDHLADPDILGR